MNSVAANDEHGNKDEGCLTTISYNLKFQLIFCCNGWNLRNAYVTSKQHDVFARIHNKNDFDLTDKRLFGTSNSVANDTKKVNRILYQQQQQPKLCWRKPFSQELVSRIKRKVFEGFRLEIALYQQDIGKMDVKTVHRETFFWIHNGINIIKLSCYLRETEEKITNGKEDLRTKEVSFLKIIVDALISDLIQFRRFNELLIFTQAIMKIG